MGASTLCILIGSLTDRKPEVNLIAHQDPVAISVICCFCSEVSEIVLRQALLMMITQEVLVEEGSFCWQLSDSMCCLFRSRVHQLLLTPSCLGVPRPVSLTSHSQQKISDSWRALKSGQAHSKGSIGGILERAVPFPWSAGDHEWLACIYVCVKEQNDSLHLEVRVCTPERFSV